MNDQTKSRQRKGRDSFGKEAVFLRRYVRRWLRVNQLGRAIAQFSLVTATTAFFASCQRGNCLPNQKNLGMEINR